VHRDEPQDDAERRVSAAAAGSPAELGIELDRLLELAVQAVPTCLGASLVMHARTPAVVLSALRAGWERVPVLASLAVRLPRPLGSPATDAGAELRIYAGAPHAFAHTAPWLLALLDMTARHVTVDGHLELPDLDEELAARERWLTDQSVIERAIGVLLDRGLLLPEGRLELARLAAVGGTDVLAAALAVLASTPRDADPS
jgi:hypothetical protein